MAKILIAEDDVELSESIKASLCGERHVVDVAHTGPSAWEMLQFYKFDLIVLDWNLPGLSGLDILTRYRDEGGKTPVLFLTGMTDLSQKETGLDSGADDYLTKPFNPRELLARVRALLRRPAEWQQATLQCGRVHLECGSCKVTKDGQPVHLTKKEFALLEFFFRHPNTVFGAEALLDRVWASESDATPETLRAYITKLRSKLDTEGQPSLIKTVHGLGYKLVPPDNDV